MSENKAQKKVTQIYAVLVAALVLNFAPMHILQIFGSILFIAAFIALYIYRANSEKDDLVHNHMTFLIRTVWIASLLLGIGILAAAALADHSSLENMMNDVMQTGIMPSHVEMQSLMLDYMRDNIGVLFLTLGPSLIYIIYRVGKGLTRALKGYRMPNPKGWF